MGFLQQFQGSGHIGSSALRILRHFIESGAIVVVLQLTERLHGLVQIVVNDGKAVATGFEGLPTRKSQVLRVVGQLHASLQHIRSSQGRERVEVQSDNEVGIVRHQRCQLVVNDLVVKVQLVELHEIEVKVGILIVIEGSGVCRVVYRTVGLDHCRTRKAVLRPVVLRHRQVEVADDAFVLLKLQLRPLAVVHPLVQRLLQVLEDALVRTLYLLAVDVDLDHQLLGAAVYHVCQSYECQQQSQEMSSL